MNTTLSFFKNLQYDPIEIGDFCIVEIYKNTIEEENILGYYIQPLKGVIDPFTTIEQKVRQLADVGLDGLVILPGRDLKQFSHKVVYAVFYNTENPEPRYPLLPDQTDLGQPAKPLNIYQTIEIENEGTFTDCLLSFSLADGADKVDFLINDDKFEIDLTSTPRLNNAKLTVDKTGVKYGNLLVDKFNFTRPPQLQHGKNILKINRLVVADVEIKYTRKY